jgi:cytoskeletal protein RodZ
VSGDDDGSWHDQQPVIVAAGIAGLVLLALLVWAVIRTADNSSRPPEPVDVAPSSATSSTYTTGSTTSSRYTVPSVQTSQDNPVVTGPPESTPEGPGGDGPSTATTTTNPYLTTTPTNAGHI